MKILVTGASGFIGHALCEGLLIAGHKVRAVQRSQARTDNSFELLVIESFDAKSPWENALHGVDVVIHLAARVHAMQERIENPLAEFRKVNVDGTKFLAQLAAQAGVRRFVYVSSVK